MVRTEEDDRIYSYTALSRSTNLRDWSKPRIITPKGQKLNYSNPGNVVRFAGEWIICLQTYPRPDYRRGGGVRWADGTARVFMMRSKDLVHWGQPVLPRYNRVFTAVLPTASAGPIGPRSYPETAINGQKLILPWRCGKGYHIPGSRS